MHRRWVGWLLLSALTLIAGADRACAQKLPADFVAAYQPAIEALRKVYSQGTIKGTLADEYGDGRSISRRFTLWLAGRTSRIDAKVTGQKGMGTAVGGTDIYMAMPGASMLAYRNGKGELANRPMDEDGYRQAKNSIGELCPISFPYTMGTPGTILSMLQRSDVKITSFKRGKVDSQPMIKIEYEALVGPDGRQGPWTCSLRLSPNEGYALRQYTCTAGHGSQQVTLSGSLSYTMSVHDEPLLAELVRSEHRGSQLVERHTISISEYKTQAPLNFQFSADAF
jgi:hypothetical protein